MASILCFWRNWSIKKYTTICTFGYYKVANGQRMTNRISNKTGIIILEYAHFFICNSFSVIKVSFESLIKDTLHHSVCPAYHGNQTNFTLIRKQSERTKTHDN